MQAKTQWKKRVELTQYIYMCLISDFNEQEIISKSFDYEYEANQFKIIEYFAHNKETAIKELSENLKQNWTWNRISITTQAILLQAYCEYKVNNLAKQIVIDQALITTERYIGSESKPFVNAILDKVFK